MNAATVAERRPCKAAFDVVAAIVFLKAVKHGSFAEAGKELGMTRSAVSKRIARLEKDLGVTLLHRTPRSISLTDVGNTFHAACLRISDAVDEAADEVRGIDAIPSGSMKISLPSALASALMPALERDLLARWPRLRVDVHVADRFVDVVAGGYDAVVRVARRLPDSSLYARRLAVTPLVLVASPAYLSRHGVPENPGDLARHRCLTHGRSVDGTATWAFRDGGRHMQVLVRSALSASCYAALVEAACADMGIVYVPEVCLSSQRARQSLRRLLPAFTAGEGYGIFALHPYRSSPIKVRAFIEVVHRRLAWLAASVA